jgi:aromatic-L-amino-acid/L-tryptophan decarboxylase
MVSAMDGHMTAEEFRRHGRELIDWIADYWEQVDRLPILPSVEPGDIRSKLPDRAPEQPEAFERIRADLDEIVMPGLVHWQSPGWFAFFPANASFPSILGELVSAGLAQQGMLWSTSPATTEIESQVLDWLVDLLGLPPAWKTTEIGGGVMQMSASDSTHTALVVARRLAHQQAPIERLVAYTSSQAHSSIEKGARVAGFDHVRLIDVDERFAMSPDALETAIATDRANGLVPTFVCSAIGTTGTTAVDPVRRVGEIARANGMWHHVDAAYAGSIMMCEEFRHHQDGLELADSYTFNPHKWMFTNFDCSVFYVADRAPLIETLSILPPYLKNQASESGAVIDYRDWHVPLGRRFRALKLWFVIRHYGAEGLRTHLRRHVELARDLEARLQAHPRLTMVAPTPFALVSFAHVGGDDETMRLADAINASGHSYVTASRVAGRSFIRVSIGQTNTEQTHVDRLWELIDAKA